MKFQLRQTPTLTVLISIHLVFISGIYTIWTGILLSQRFFNLLSQSFLNFLNILSYFNISSLIFWIIGVLFLLSGYYMLQQESRENGMYLALGTGITLLLWFSMTAGLSLGLLFYGIFPIIGGVLALRTISKSRKQIWVRRIKGFWEDFSHNKIGLLGLVIILGYIAVAFLQPVLAIYDPEERSLAEAYATPEWMTIFNPALNSLPRTTNYNLTWQNSTVLPQGVTVEHVGKEWTTRYQGNESVVVAFYTIFSYQYSPPRTFYYQFYWKSKLGFVAGKATLRYSLELNLTTPAGKVYPVWDQHWWKYRISSCLLRNPFWKAGDPADTFRYPGMTQYKAGYEGVKKKWGHIPLWDFDSSQQVYITHSSLAERLGYQAFEESKVSTNLFTPPGNNYTLQLYITFMPIRDNASCNITFSKVDLHVPGLLWGLLGTEKFGRDVWSRVVSGARVSIAVGIAAAVISVAIGVVVGVVSGYFGGIVDEGLMRLVDILLCLPLLPLLMLFVSLFGNSILYIILLIALFGWLGSSRMIRSQILSLRELPFVECAKASGASSLYIMFRHLVPNVMPIAMTDLILSVPGAILFEAALSFLGFGDPRTPTWGREFSYMQTLNAWQEGAWWWIIPPGLAITFLCVGFVFFGHALDEIINPRLRRRR